MDPLLGDFPPCLSFSLQLVGASPCHRVLYVAYAFSLSLSLDTQNSGRLAYRRVAFKAQEDETHQSSFSSYHQLESDERQFFLCSCHLIFSLSLFLSLLLQSHKVHPILLLLSSMLQRNGFQLWTSLSFSPHSFIFLFPSLFLTLTHSLSFSLSSSLSLSLSLFFHLFSSLNPISS